MKVLAVSQAAALAPELDLVQGQVRLAQEQGRGPSGVGGGELGVAHGEGEGVLLPLVPEGPALFREGPDALGGALAGAVLQDEAELVPAVAAQDAVRGEMRVHALGQLAQGLVPDGVAVDIIDGLEVVDVQKNAHAVGLGVFGQIGLQGLVKALAVEQAREGVRRGQVAEDVFLLPHPDEGQGQDQRQEHDETHRAEEARGGVCLLPAPLGYDLQLPGAVGAVQGEGIADGVCERLAGAGDLLIVVAQGRVAFREAVVVPEALQRLGGPGKDLRHPQDNDGEAPEGLLPGLVREIDGVAHGDAAAALAQGEGALQGDDVVVPPIAADLAPFFVLEQVDLSVLIARSRVDVGDDAVGGQLNALEDGGGEVLRHGLKALALAVLADEDLLQGVCHADGLGEILNEVVGVGGGVELGLFPAGFQSVLV